MLTKVAIIGGGPAGLMCAINAKRIIPFLDITIFDKKDIASTLLPTGGGRCNLSFFELDIKAFAANYPRGEKFLYSIFNQFFINDTLEFFKSIGIKTYTQKDNRIFPKSDKSLDVIFALKNEVKRLNIKVIKAEINDIKIDDNNFIVNDISFDKLVIATGGKKNLLLNSIKKLGHNIIEQKPALCGLEIKEKFFNEVSGLSFKKISSIACFNNKKIELKEDLLFTHKGISGPLAYKISSLFSKEEYNLSSPIKLYLNFIDNDIWDFQKILNENAKKDILSLVSGFTPKSMAKLLLNQNNIELNKKCHQINKTEREVVKEFLTNLSLTVVSPLKEGEIVSSGGIDLREINSKTMESKIIKNLFFCGEVVDIDGFCGGFNLQNCWSTGYVAATHLE